VKRKSWDDQNIEVIIGTLLRVGVLLAASVVVIGAAVYLVRHGHDPLDYSTFRGEPAGLTTVAGVLRGVTQGSGSALIQLGLLVLIATPVARVAFSAVAFALERDYLYVAITLVVLAVLLYSFLGPA
jgi:uncharacterized membrane protein